MCAELQTHDQPVDPLGRVGGEPHADHAAERHADVGDALEAEASSSASTSPPRSAISYGPGGSGERAVAAVVEAHARGSAARAPRARASHISQRRAERGAEHAATGAPVGPLSSWWSASCSSRADRQRAVDQRARRRSRSPSRPAACSRIRSASTSRPPSRSAAQAAAEPTSVSSSRERAPLRLPGAGRALVLLRHRREHRRDEARHARRAGEDRDARDRVALVRHRRGSAAARPAALAQLGRPRSARTASTSRAIFASTPASTPSALASSAGPHADRAPGQRRLGEPERRRRRAPRPPARRVPTGPPICTGEPALARPRAAARSASSQPDQPAGGAQAEGGQLRLLQQRARRHRRVAVRARRAPARRRRRRAGVGQQRLERPRARRSIAAVSMMSWLVAPRCTCGAASLADRRAQRGDDRDHRRRAVAGRRARSSPRSKRSARQAAAIASAARGRDQPLGGAGARERRLDVEHRGQPGAPVGRARPRRRARRARRTGPQTAKKTVSPGPWRRMSIS